MVLCAGIAGIISTFTTGQHCRWLQGKSDVGKAYQGRDSAWRCCDVVCRELVQYKYVVINADGSVDRWQPGDNLQMEVPVAQVSF